jgi:hypothetical protein
MPQRPSRLSVLMVAVMLAPAAAFAQENCMMHFVDQSDNRLVFGAVNEECSGDIHSEPFGNWGVDSSHGGRYDGFQFAGWKQDDGWLQWNSCTDEFPPPDPTAQYFNWGYDGSGYTTQIGTSDSSHTNYWTDVLPWGCGAETGTIFSASHFMNVYELDFDGDDFIATINFPIVNATLSCSEGYCSTTSDLADPSSVNPNVMTAQWKYFVEMWEW